MINGKSRFDLPFKNQKTEAPFNSHNVRTNAYDFVDIEIGNECVEQMSSQQTITVLILCSSLVKIGQSSLLLFSKEMFTIHTAMRAYDGFSMIQ